MPTRKFIVLHTVTSNDLQYIIGKKAQRAYTTDDKKFYYWDIETESWEEEATNGGGGSTPNLDAVLNANNESAQTILLTESGQVKVAIIPNSTDGGSIILRDTSGQEETTLTKKSLSTFDIPTGKRDEILFPQTTEGNAYNLPSRSGEIELTATYTEYVVLGSSSYFVSEKPGIYHITDPGAPGQRNIHFLTGTPNGWKWTVINDSGQAITINFGGTGLMKYCNGTNITIANNIVATFVSSNGNIYRYT